MRKINILATMMTITIVIIFYLIYSEETIDRRVYSSTYWTLYFWIIPAAVCVFINRLALQSFIKDLKQLYPGKWEELGMPVIKLIWFEKGSSWDIQKKAIKFVYNDENLNDTCLLKWRKIAIIFKHLTNVIFVIGLLYFGLKILNY